MMIYENTTVDREYNRVTNYAHRFFIGWIFFWNRWGCSLTY